MSTGESSGPGSTPPEQAELAALLSLADREHRAGRLAEAAAAYRRFLALRPGAPAVHNNLGILLSKQGRLDEALPHFQRAIQLRPANPDAQRNLARALKQLGRLDEAAAAYRQTITLEPGDFRSRLELGTIFQTQGNLDQAAVQLEQALAMRDDLPAAHHSLAGIRVKQGRLDEGIAQFRRAIALDETYLEAHCNLALALTKVGQLDEALAHFETAQRLRPDSAETHMNRALACLLRSDVDAALAQFDRALAIRPDYPEAHMNRGLAYLLRGDFERGWSEYRWRWKCHDFPEPDFHRPLWRGEAIEGKRILLRAEQGFGDAFQFIRYAKLVKQRGARVLLWAAKPLAGLLGLLPDVDEVFIKSGPLPEFDVHAPLLDLPAIFGTTIATIPASVPYLIAEPKLVDHWQEKLVGIREFKVGINWQGNPKYRGDRRRSIPLAQFAPLAAVPGVRLINLQKGLGTEQLEGAGFPVTELGADFDEASGPFMDTAAVLKNLDLVITSDTALPHLAGGLGVPTWVALPLAADWRWLLEREDSPWYPTMRLFRQTEFGRWEPVFERMASQLAELTALTASAGPEHRAGRVAEADTAGEHNNLGVLLCQQGKLEEALTHFERALEARPAFLDALWNLAQALKQLDRLDKAADTYRRAIALEPGDFRPHVELGWVLRTQGKLDEAAAELEQALAILPDLPQAHNELAIVRREQNRWDEAIGGFRRAIEAIPSWPEPRNNLGATLVDVGQFDEALAHYGKALELWPDYPEAHWNRALAKLTLGDFEHGWNEYEWRWKSPGFKLPGLTQPRWQGEPIEGRRIVIHCEQGLGDTFQFIRYAELVKRRGATVLLWTYTPLEPLMRLLPYVDQVIPWDARPTDFDVQSPLVSLPGVFGTTLATIPTDVPYLRADPKLVEHWREKLSRIGQLKVGICWQGNPRFRGDRHRSIPLAQFAPLAAVPGVRLISLQKGLGTEQLQGAGFPVMGLGADFDDTAGRFMDTAAVLENLDLLITCDTALSHLAGGLGVPTWAALRYPADWRWLVDREDSPWYPTMRLFRQSQSGRWEPVFQRMASQLAELVELFTSATREQRAGRPAEAAAAYRTILKLQPGSFQAHGGLATALRKQGKLDEAVKSCKQAIAFRPQAADAHNNLGVLLCQQGKLDEAVTHFERALEVRSDFPDALRNLAQALRQLGQAEAQPDLVHLHNQLGILRRKQNRREQAITEFRRAIQLLPTWHEAHNNLAATLVETGKFDEGLAHYDQAIALWPDYPEAHWNRALANLLRGDFEQGWKEYEWRWKCPGFKLPGLREPRWQGEPIEGRRIVIHAEQGLGDVLQFVRYAKLLKQRGATVLFWTLRPLEPLMRLLPYLDGVVPADSRPTDCDFQLPLISLPGVFGTTLATVPAGEPYLFADSQLVDRWRDRLSAIRELKVGITWQGNPSYRTDALRSIPLAQFAPLADVPGVRLFSLQKGFGAEQLEGAGFPVTELGTDFDETSGPFMDTAAVLKNLDLVITSDTALPHLAGGLGVPTWTAIPYAPDWRWLLDRDDSPWYPAMRLLRQSESGRWEPVFQRMAKLLAEMAASKR